MTPDLNSLMRFEMDTYTIIGVGVVLVICLLTKDLIGEFAKRLCGKCFPESDEEKERLSLQRELLEKFTVIAEKQKTPCESHLAITQQVREKVDEIAKIKSDLVIDKIRTEQYQKEISEDIKQSDDDRHYILLKLEWTSRALWMICQKVGVVGLPDEPKRD